jgi:DNA (cytosine-5)-methyltransferase 1
MDEKFFDWRSRHWNYLLMQDPDRPTWTLQADPGTYVGPFHWRSRPYSLLE